MTQHNRHRLRAKLRSWYVWHRWLGILAALFVVMLAVTGIALNHTEALRLDQRLLQNTALLGWYDIELPQELASYTTAAGRLTQIGKRWFLDQQQLAGEFNELRGAVVAYSLLVAAGSDSVWLLTERGEVAEHMDRSAGVPPSVQRIGVDANHHLVLDAASGFYRSDSDLLQWRRTEPTEAVQWAKAQPLPDGLRNQLLRQYRGPGLPLERVLLDLHSGRIFGSWGVYLMDGAALIMVLLAGSGVWLWLRAQLSRSRR